jgi:hypothetical protein
MNLLLNDEEGAEGEVLEVEEEATEEVSEQEDVAVDNSRHH